MVDKQPTALHDIESVLNGGAGTRTIEVKKAETGVTLHWDSISRSVEVEGDVDIPGNRDICNGNYNVQSHGYIPVFHPPFLIGKHGEKRKSVAQKIILSEMYAPEPGYESLF